MLHPACTLGKMAATGSAKLMSFVSEKDVEEMKKKRQEQWEKVRKPGDPKGEMIYITDKIVTD